MFRSPSLLAVYYSVDLLNTITDHVHIIIPLQVQIYCTGMQMRLQRWIRRTVNWNLFTAPFQLQH